MPKSPGNSFESSVSRAVTAWAALFAAPSFAGTQLPIVCVAGSCGNNATSFVGSGQATATVSGSTLTVNQSSEQALLNWASFNVGADGKVIFNQPNSSAIALNQIFQASPSQIFGLVQANGQIYLVNQNGFIFGPSSTVNVGGLLASTLPLTAPLATGLLAPLQNGMPALASDGRSYVLDGNGNPVLGADGNPIPVSILVQPGAQLTVANGSRLMLAGQSVMNGGSLTAADGQVILAAGQSAYIEASTDPNLRGLIVEVDSGGLVENQTQGSISVSEGNVTLVGLAVNQQGRISATTSVSEGGSISLLARDTVNLQAQANGVLVPVPSHGGTLTLGPTSQTTVLPDTTSTATAIDEQAQPQSTITLAGQTIQLTDGSQVVAPSGDVTITASSNPGVANSQVTTPDPTAQLRIDSGATIDVSGSTASVPVTQNLVSVQLRGSELADSPLQRDGALRGQTVIVDARVGTPLADVSGDIALIQRGVLQRTTAGGSITLDSGGDVVVANGATLNVSGGQVDFTPGIMQTSLLTKPDGTTVNIGNASPNQVYTGVVNPTFESISNQWGVISFIPTPGIAYYDPGYVQGSSAGSIKVLGSSMVLNGNFLGQAVNGIYQRSGSGVASGGTFQIGVTTPALPATPDFRAPAVELVNETPSIVVAPGAPLPSDLPVELSTSVLSIGGFTNLEISSNDRITVPAGVPLDLGPGGSITLQAPQIDLDSSVKIPAGTVQLTSLPSLTSPAGTPGLGIFVGDGVNFDVSGMWTNDSLLPLNVTASGLALVNAGSVQLDQDVFQGTLGIGSYVGFTADGGAQLARGGALTSGTGGAIGIIGSPGGTVTVGNGLSVDAFGVQGAKGGAFSLEVPRLEISPSNSSWVSAQTSTSDPTSSNAFVIDSSLFSNFGFSAFLLTADGPSGPANQNVLTVLPGTSIDLQTSTLLLNTSYAQQPTGKALSGFATVTLLPEYQRSADELTLQAIPGNITAPQIGDFTVGQNTSIVADPGSTITLASTGNLTIDGSIHAPDGNVNLEILTPAESLDPGFVPSLQLTLGATSAIDVSGTTIYQPDQTGVLTGTVLPGGAVSVAAARGAVVTDAGSTINFSGTQAPIDVLGGPSVTTEQQELVASAAGSLSISSQEAISLLGNYQGMPGVGTTGRAAGGTLTLTLASPAGTLVGFPGSLMIDVQSDPLTDALTSSSGTAVLSTTQLSNSGVDALNLIAQNGVAFQSGTQLNLARSLALTTPAITVVPQTTAATGEIQVSAPYIAMGTASTTEVAATATPGVGSIAFSGGEVDLIGSLAFQQIGNATITSSGEILLRGELIDALNTGSVSIAGDLTLSAARVVPTTMVDFTINSSGGSDNTVTFTQNGALSGVPLSVAGSLSVTADNIIQDGTIFAPFGQLSFSANDNLTFAPGSLTSVSGTSSVLPYGEVQNGNTWVYQVSPNQLGPAIISSLPNRQVSVTGAKVTLASGATIDVSGGGDLDGYQWTPGTGGTVDVLSNTQTPGLYAIVPSLEGQTAPYDPMMWAGSNLAPNESIYLSGGGGLAAGVYPLLPARYGLLPGAFLVSVVSGYQDLQPGVTAQSGNGFPIVSGYLTYGSTGIGDTRTSGFLVEPGTYAQTLAAYTNVAASTFFAGATNSSSTTPTIPSSPLPADAGTLIVLAQNGFNALGDVNGAAGQGGEGATIEINAPQLEIDPSVQANSSSGSLTHLSSAVLDSWDPGRLWLGLDSEPSTAAGQSGSSFAVTASSVEVTTGSSLSADEIVLAATGLIRVDGGASLTTTSIANSSATPAASSAAATSMPLNGTSAGAAILAESDLNYWLPDRSGATPATQGVLDVVSGATVGSRGALTFDAPGGGTLADGTLSGTGAQWSFAASAVTFGPQGSAANGFAIDSSLLGALQSASSVRVASSSSIGLDEQVDLGVAQPLNEIDIVAPGITNSAGTGTSTFAAGLITLTGTTAQAITPQVGTGNLALIGSEIDVGPGNLALSGFASSTIDASSVIVGVGQGSLNTAGSLSALAPLLTADSESQTQFIAGGAITLAPSSRAAVGSAPVLQTGGSLSFSGSAITDGTQITMPSGEAYFNAGQQLVLAGGAGIDVAGINPVNAAHGSDGGSISLNAGGSVSVSSGVNLSVAAGAGADAGSISVVAGGSAALAGQLDGGAQTGNMSGSFSLQAGSLLNFSALNDLLESSGFHQLRSIEVGSGDLDLAAGSSITAQNVVLTADSGAITIAGNIDATDTSGGGSITVAAHGNLTVNASGSLSANGTDAGSLGGQIELTSVAGNVQFDPASQVAATGTGSSGTLLVRAPRSATGNDVNILSLPSDLTDVGSVVLEPIISQTISAAPTAANFASIESNLATYMSSAQGAITSRLDVADASNVVVRPYADITANGNLTLPSVDFSNWRFDGQPADISIRATGSITVEGTLSDGFAMNPNTGSIDVMASGSSAGISLVAGANLGSASATGVVNGATANLMLNPGSIVRTGTGALQLTAAQDVVFGKGASVYTGGIQGVPSTTNTDTGIPLSFPTDGGSITVNAGRDILGAAVTEAVDQWNPRFQPLVGNNSSAVWGVDFQQFGWNIGALGGGNVTLNAGRNAVNVTAAVADSFTFVTNGMYDPSSTVSASLGGGNLTVSIGGNVGSGLFYVGNGVGRIAAGGALSDTLSDSAGQPIGTLLLAGDASYYVKAQGDINLQGILSETALAPGFNSDPIFFFRYDPSSILAVQSLGGSITYDANSVTDAPFIGSAATFHTDPGTFEAAPPSIDLAAFGSDVVLGSTLEALPSTNGELSVYAARDLTTGGAALGMSDQLLDTIASVANPSEAASVLQVITLTYTGASLHQNDPIPVVISAGRNIYNSTFDLPKFADISAGQDILSTSLSGQNLNPNDVTVVSAGRNISYTPDDISQTISVTGPGQLDLIAGGNIDLSATSGVTTYGNILNPNLASSTGASINVVAGLGAPIDVGGTASSTDFVSKVITPSTAYQSLLEDYVEQQTGQSQLTYSAAAAEFRTFNLGEQLPLIENVFFNELNVSGQEANQVPSLGFGRGYAAIDSLFPESRGTTSPYNGSLTLGYSRIYTLDGGSISILVPGGGIDVGFATAPANFTQIGVVRQPSDLGIVAVGSGNVDIYALNDVEVDQSRIFTLGGGDITIWSTLGNIDAGNGAKTSVSAPPPTIEVSASGTVTLDYSGAVAGSGIRTIQAEPDVAAGDVSLIAPVGFVDAGDAGIGAAGNINIAAQRVIGASNINFGGTATGVPPEVSGIGASLSGASSVANSTTTASSNSVENSQSAAATAAPLSTAALGWLDVFVEGFGEEACKAEDVECLKRNQKSK
jgi:filamentous hemagglutinin